MYYAMSLDAGVCYDESELCVKKANAGKCINSALHEVANFCKKACGLCGIYIGLLFTPPPHEVQAGTLRDGDVHLFFFVCFLFVRLSFCRLKRVHKTRFSRKLSNLQLWSLLTMYRKPYVGFSNNPFFDP